MTTRVGSSRRGWVLVAVIVVVAVALIAWGVGRPDQTSVPTTTAASDRLDVGRGLVEAVGEAVFGDAIALGYEPDALGGDLLPDCFGPVISVAVIARDLGETYWDLKVGQGPPTMFERMQIGVVPDGYVESIELDEKWAAGPTLVVVAGQGRMAAGIVEPRKARPVPATCDVS